jgi:hypothetical protein
MNDVTARPNSLLRPPIIYLAAIAICPLSNVLYQLPWFGHHCGVSSLYLAG